jgi:hypothetical protein
VVKIIENIGDCSSKHYRLRHWLFTMMQFDVERNSIEYCRGDRTVRNRRVFRRRKRWNKVLERKLAPYDPKKIIYMEANMPLILWLLGVPLVIVIALMLTHVI